MSLPAAETLRGAITLPRFVARVRGEKALSFLDDTTTADLSGAGPGTVASTCYLDAKGGLLAVFRLSVLAADHIVIDAEDTCRAAIMERLGRIAPLSGVTIEDDERVVVAVRGEQAPKAEPMLDANVIVIPVEGGVDRIAGADEMPTGPVIDDATWEAARVAAGHVRFGIDVLEGTLVNETPYFPALVAADKGCYPGQESVAKVRNLGSIRRHVVALSLDGSAPTPTPLSDGDEDVGRLTSAVDGRGIGTVKATRGPGQELAADGARAVIDRVL